jgi:3-dehydroquinate synthase
VLPSLRIILAGVECPIHIRAGNVGSLLKAAADEETWRNRRHVVLTDESVAASWGESIERAFPSVPLLKVAPSEGAKSAASLARLWEAFASFGLDRGSVVWIVGGGVVGDLGGFAAATYLRGIDCVQVPTTLLAMVDSSVGGKTGINLNAGKNLAGAFHQPRAVYIFPEFLRTLPAREFAAGAAEVIKYGLLGDAALPAELEREPLTAHGDSLPRVIRRCCELKAAIVQSDERETVAEGGRALLNLGHTFGHAIEQVAGYGTYLHGEAVAIGLCAAAHLSQRLRLISPAEVARIDAIVAAHQLPVRLRDPLPLEALLAAMAHDKKNREGGIRFVVLEAIGRAATRAGVPLTDVEAVWREVGAA